MIKSNICPRVFAFRLLWWAFHSNSPSCAAFERFVYHLTTRPASLWLLATAAAFVVLFSWIQEKCSDVIGCIERGRCSGILVGNVSFMGLGQSSSAHSVLCCPRRINVLDWEKHFSQFHVAINAICLSSPCEAPLFSSRMSWDHTLLTVMWTWRSCGSLCSLR